MDKIDGLFDKEEKVISRIESVISDNKNNKSALFDEYLFLVNEYKKLNKQTKKLIDISDQHQKSLNKTKNDLKHLNEISKQISRTLNFNDVFNSVTNYLFKAYGFQGVSLALVDKKSKSYAIEKVLLPGKYKNFYNLIDHKKIALDESSGGIAKSIIKNEIRYFSEINPDDIMHEISRNVALKLNIKTILIIPVSVEESVIGAFTLTSHEKSIELSRDDIASIARFVNQISIIIKNSKLYEQLQIERQNLEERVKERTKELEHALELVEEKRATISQQFSDSIEIIYSIIAKTSSRLYERTKEITTICLIFAGHLGFNFQQRENLRVAAMLHDLGMIGVRERLIYEHKNFTQDEKEYIQSHPHKSVEIIQTMNNTEDIKRIILQHHERYDGKGYPNALKGDEIDLLAKVLIIVSYFVDITKKRSFQSKNRNEKIKNELESQKGKMLDPVLTSEFIDLIERASLIYDINEKDIEYFMEDNQHKWSIPSNVHFENMIVGRVMDKVKQFDVNADDLYVIDYGLCELIRNAIVHGNEYNEEKTVVIKFQAMELEKNRIEFVFQISDQGKGMNVKQHNVFSQARSFLFNILDTAKSFSRKNNLEKSSDFINLLNLIKSFMHEYYTDFHTFRQLDLPEATGGVGLLHVKKTFDSIDFKNIVINNEIAGTNVTVTKVV